MNKILILPKVEPRIESGAVQFGKDDWPGLFIRGDDCFIYSVVLGDVLETGNIGMIDRRVLGGLLEALNSTRI